MVAHPELFTTESGTKQYRSVWISDIHLGTRHAQVDALLEFLRVVDCKYLYLVGDFIDGWELKFRWFWRDDYNVLIQKLLRKSRKQTKVIYISGNHDEFIEQFFGMRFGSVTIAREVMHTAADGKKYLVIHGRRACLRRRPRTTATRGCRCGGT